MLHMLGNQISTELRDLLIKDCTAEAVPSSRAKLSKSDEVKLVARYLQNFFVEKGFLKIEGKSLVECAANVNLVFSSKACAHSEACADPNEEAAASHGVHHACSTADLLSLRTRRAGSLQRAPCVWGSSCLTSPSTYQASDQSPVCELVEL